MPKVLQPVQDFKCAGIIVVKLPDCGSAVAQHCPSMSVQMVGVSSDPRREAEGSSYRVVSDESAATLLGRQVT